MYTVTLKATELGMGGPAGQSIALPVGSDGQARRGYAISGTFQGDSDSGSWLSVHASSDPLAPKPPAGPKLPRPQVAPVKCSVSLSGLGFSGPGGASHMEDAAPPLGAWDNRATEEVYS